MTKLPDKLSAMLRVAMVDLERVEQIDDYVVDMVVWHEGDYVKKCMVCLAGAVMAQTLGAVIWKSIQPDNYDEETCDRLYAIDDLRRGNVGIAFLRIGLTIEAGQEFDRVIPIYYYDQTGFKAALVELARDLEEGGY